MQQANASKRDLKADPYHLADGKHAYYLHFQQLQSAVFDSGSKLEISHSVQPASLASTGVQLL
jgi:hypothetical protein